MYVCHASFGGSHHGLELRDEVFETESLASRLGAGGFSHDVDDMDVEVVVCRLICCRSGIVLMGMFGALERTVDVKLQHVPLKPLI